MRMGNKTEEIITAEHPCMFVVIPSQGISKEMLKAYLEEADFVFRQEEPGYTKMDFVVMDVI